MIADQLAAVKSNSQRHDRQVKYSGIMLLPILFLLSGDLLHEPFSGDALGKEWKIGKGQWRIVEGRLEGTELAADKHAAVVRRDVRFRDGVVRYSVRLDGAKTAHLSINGAGGHICRLILTPSSAELRRDKPNAKSEEKAASLAKATAAFAPGVWYDVEVSFQGRTMSARIQSANVTIKGEHDAIAAEKTNIGFPVTGATASFDNVRVSGL